MSEIKNPKPYNLSGRIFLIYGFEFWVYLGFRVSVLEFQISDNRISRSPNLVPDHPFTRYPFVDNLKI